MGQKVHPLGFRLGITQKHQSQWYARFHQHQYSQAVVEDHVLRQTLTKLFGQLAQQKTKTDAEAPRITQIKIERGWMPYEIGIHIHAENCKRLKASLDQLKLDRETVHALQKARRSLSDLTGVILPSGVGGSAPITRQPKNRKKAAMDAANGRGRGLFRSATANQKGLRRMSSRRQRKRQAIRAYWRNRWTKGLRVVYQRGKWMASSGVVRNLAQSTRRSGLNVSTRRQKRDTRRNTRFASNTRNTFNRNASPRVALSPKITGQSSVVQPVSVAQLDRSTLSMTQKAVLKSTLKQLNVHFLKQLRQQVQAWKKRLPGQTAPLAYMPTWSLRRLKTLKNQPRVKLVRLLQTLQTRAWKRLDHLRRECLAYGGLTSTQVLGYYQIGRFLQALKRLVKSMKADSKLSGTTRKKKKAHITPPDGSPSWRMYALRQRLQNLTDNQRRMKLLVYLKQLVQKHRQQHIYYYLSTLQNARVEWKNLQQLTRENASYLFDLTESNLAGNNEQNKENVKERVRTVLSRLSDKAEWDKTLKDVFVEQLEKQRRMLSQTLQLTPMISVKFFAVKAKDVGSKALVIASSIVDQIEQRKAFRKVIKDCKKQAMKQHDVRGVKIQVAGRLNGAEIARTEWVRSGRVPLQTLRANIDYNYQTAQTIYGVIGVKVWVFKGYHA